MTPEQVADNRVDLHTFTRTMFKARKGVDFVTNWHHEALCNALERVVIGKTKRLIINIPPRYSKTELAVVNFMAWCMGNFPDSEFIHASYSARLAANNSYQTRALLASETYAEIFPSVKLMGDSKAKDEWRTNHGGIVYATGSEGTITGYGAGKLRLTFGGAIIIDDPHKASEASSDIMRQNVIDWFQTTMESRCNSPDTPIIVIMQRLHENDLAGWLLAGGNGEHWDHVCIPVRNSEGEPLWPFKHDAETLDRMEASNRYVFAGQYMQRPSPIGGGLIRGAWFGRYKIPPVIKYRKIIADTAMKTAERNDYSVFECWGYGEDGKIYLLDLLRGKWEAPELKRRALDFWNKHKPSQPATGALRQMLVEDKASGTGLIQDLRTNAQIPIKGIERTKDKLTRVMDVVSFIESGYVMILEEAPWVSDFIAECESFTADDSHAHDDQIDPMCDAINDMLASNAGLKAWENLI